MKNKTKFALVGTVLLSSFALLAACSSSSKGSSSSTSSSKELAIVIPAADHGWLAGVNYYAQQEVKNLGVKNYHIYTSANIQDQASQLQQVITSKAGAVVLEPQNDNVSVQAKQVVNAKIPLVVYDRKVEADYNSFVAGNNPGIGTKSADYLGKALGGKGTVAVMNVPAGGSVSTERVDAFTKEMKSKYPNVKLVTFTAANFTSQDGLKSTIDMLNSNKSVDAIFSIDDEDSIGALQAVKNANRSDVKFISGAGGDQAYLNKIKDGGDITLFTATYSPKMIQDAIKNAYDLMQGKKVSKEKIIQPVIVTKDNVNKYLDAKSPY